MTLAYSVLHLLSADATDWLMFALNLLSCVLMPLDQLDKLLTTKDISYCNYSMNFLNAASCLIWGFSY